ncbi:MAG: OmpA family protein [Elusimicrobiota bacterium]
MSFLSPALSALFLLASSARAADNSAFGLVPDKGRVVWSSEVFDRDVYPNLERLLPDTSYFWCAESAPPPEPAKNAVITKVVSAWEVVVDSAAIPPLRFEVAKFELRPEHVALIRDALVRVQNMPDIRNVKLKVTGHTDSSPIIGQMTLTIPDNWALSRSRAAAVGDLLREKLALGEDMIVTDGKADTEPLASNDTPEGKALNRRVEVQVIYEKEVASVITVPAPPVVAPPAAPCAVSPAYSTALGYRLSVDGKVLEGGGRTDVEAQRCQDSAMEQAGISIQADGHEYHKVLSVGAWPDPAWKGQPISFTGYWNYSRWIKQAEARLFAPGRSPKSRPFAVVPLDQRGRGSWSPSGPDGIPGFRLVLRVYDEKGRFDETEPYNVSVSPETRGPLSGPVPERERNVVYGKNRLVLDRIPVKGSAVTVSGTRIGPGRRVFALGFEVPVSSDGAFAVQEILPPGRHDVAVRIEGPEPMEFLRPVYIAQDRWFYVALADLTVGGNHSRGPAALVTADPEHYDKNVFVDGRAAYYLKGRIKGDWLLTASADTREQLLANLFTGFDEKDPRYLLRRLDPDLYYPVYGDDSTMTEDAPTQGKFYVRLERGESHIMWGNYTVSLHGNELASVDRGLYGARLHAVTGSTTKYGERRAALDGFLGDPGTLSAREEYRGTGGSLYYLKHLDIAPGSDFVSIEVRDKYSGLVLRTQDLVRGQDYDIDSLQSRIVLSRPLSSASDDSTIVRTDDIPGNPVFLVVRYEYQPGLAQLRDYDFGGRASKWFGDHFELGANAVRQNGAGGGDTRIEGVDATLRYTPSTYIKGEVAQSRGSGPGEQGSLDGGFSFNAVAQDRSGRKADAAHVEGALQLSDLKTGWEGSLTGYWKNRERGFSAPGQLTVNETEQFGGAISKPLPGQIQANVKYDQVREQSSQKVQTLDVELRKGWGDHWSTALGGHGDSRQNVAASSSVILSRTGERADIGAQLGYDSLTNWALYGFGQGSVEKDMRKLIEPRYGMGGRWSPAARWTLTGEGSAGQNRYGGKLGSEVRFNERSTFYTSYQLETARSDTRVVGRTGQLVTGVRARYSDSASVFGEERWQYGTGPTGLTHAYGLDVAELDGWHWGLTGEYGTLSDPVAGDFRRSAATGSMGVTRKDITWSSALEFRDERGRNTRQTWLTRHSLDYRLNPAWRLLTKVAFSWSCTGQGDYYSGEYTEGVLGFAYRPTSNDKLNSLFKYTYFHDLASPGQLTVTSATSDYRQKSHVVSADVNYDLAPPLSIGGKYAVRLAQVQAGRTGGSPWLYSNAHLGILRLDWHVVRHWDFLAEGRQLRVFQARDARTGELVALYRHLGNNLKLGVGYNFTDFSDDLTDLSYTSRGWFVNILAKF